MRDNEQVLKLTEGISASAANISRLSRLVPAQDIRWGFDQWEMRRRAASKFSLASEMLFVREALEQATHERVAAYHASLFPLDQKVVDATVGIGADLIALAQRGPAAGCEIDPERAACARHNLGVYHVPGEVIEQDCLSMDWDESFAFADPARRVASERTLDPDRFAPNTEALASRMRDMELGAMKLSPLLPDAFLEGFGGRLEFVEFAGECREALVVFGQAIPVERVAVQVDTGERLAAMDAWESQDTLAEYLVEASPAAIRTHCLGQFGIPLLAETNGYLTSNTATQNPWLKCYPVLWQGRFDVGEIARRLRAMDAATPEIKQRGAGQDLANLRKKWIGTGKAKVIVALWSVGKSLRATILERGL